MRSRPFRQRAGETDQVPSRRRQQMSGIPSPGNIYAFRTGPYSEFAPPETGRYAAFKVIGSSEKLVAIAVLDGVWAMLPSLDQAQAASILHEHRFAHTGRLAVFGVNAEQWTPSELREVVLLGTVAVFPAE